MNTNERLKRARRWALAILAVLAMGAFATRPYVASETQDQFWDETKQCLLWLLQDFPRHQRECVGDGIGPGVYNDTNRPGPSGDPCPDIRFSGAGTYSDPCDCYDGPGGGGGNAGNAGGGIPCPGDANLSDLLFGFFQPEEPEVAYL